MTILSNMYDMLSIHMLLFMQSFFFMLHASCCASSLLLHANVRLYFANRVSFLYRGVVVCSKEA